MNYPEGAISYPVSDLWISLKFFSINSFVKVFDLYPAANSPPLTEHKKAFRIAVNKTNP